MVGFRRTPLGFTAVSVVFEKPPVFDSRMNLDVLVLTPRAFAQRLAQRYGAELALTKPPRCRNAICSVTFASRASPLRVTFGRTPARGTFLNLWNGSGAR